jgi:hypothetical protein
MDRQAPDRTQPDFKQQPERRASWNWRATGLFYPETEDWALNRPVAPPNAPTENGAPERPSLGAAM